MDQPVFYYDNPRPPKRNIAALIIGILALVLAVCLVGALFLLPLLQDRLPSGSLNATPTPTVAATQTPRPTPLGGEVELGGPDLLINPTTERTVFETIYEQLNPAVVTVNNYTNMYREEVLNGMGSGVVISKQGHIITNAHVISGASRVTVTFSDGQEIEADVLGADERGDIAVVQVDRTDLTVAPIGDSDQVTVGQYALVLGNPDGLAGTMTIGYITGPRRTMTVSGSNYALSVLQTDAAINPGNSGGALLNIRGELIGIPALKSTFVGTDEYGNAIAAEGLGFAIPINNAMEIASEIIEKGYYSRPMLSVQGNDISEYQASRGLPYGFWVRTVIDGGAAQKAGVKVNDIIIKVAGERIEGIDDLSTQLSEYSPGDTITITVYRDGNELDLSVVLDDVKPAS